jgi:sugar O-acyltransferase (sialic acid O-acetyltransferase NeuD family)
MKKLFLIGGGGHCRSCIDVIESQTEFKIHGIFDVAEKVGEKILGYEIIATDSDLNSYVKADHYFLVTVGQIKSSAIREKIFQNLLSLNANIATVVSGRSHVSKHAAIKKGTIVMHDCLVNAAAEVGENCILNSKSLIEHDSRIGNHCHISTAAIVNGNCVVNDSSFVGSNAVLREGAILPRGTIVSAGDFYNVR